ncbi:hypothetical protein OSB04_019527 [Centaurea solstitialis]|uniref:Maturase K n=1 Tax=Centaurea solstitialis TaxID=347529 RepID=A0AA38SS63_9ASTR|nr:hypothetical protein OSB04_019527 [Centaurea solstitialis]
MLNLRLLTNLLLLETSGKEPEYGLCYQNITFAPQFQRFAELLITPTDHLINILYFTTNDERRKDSFEFRETIKAELKERMILERRSIMFIYSSFLKTCQICSDFRTTVIGFYIWLDYSEGCLSTTVILEFFFDGVIPLRSGVEFFLWMPASVNGNLLLSEQYRDQSIVSRSTSTPSFHAIRCFGDPSFSISLFWMNQHALVQAVVFCGYQTCRVIYRLGCILCNQLQLLYIGSAKTSPRRQGSHAQRTINNVKEVVGDRDNVACDLKTDLMAPPTTVVQHHSHQMSIRSILEKEKLNHSNFLDWYRNLRIVLKQEKRNTFLRNPFPKNPNLLQRLPMTSGSSILMTRSMSHA